MTTLTSSLWLAQVELGIKELEKESQAFASQGRNKIHKKQQSTVTSFCPALWSIFHELKGLSSESRWVSLLSHNLAFRCPCNKAIGTLTNQFLYFGALAIFPSLSPGRVLNELRLFKICCRNRFLTFVNEPFQVVPRFKVIVPLHLYERVASNYVESRFLSMFQLIPLEDPQGLSFFTQLCSPKQQLKTVTDPVADPLLALQSSQSVVENNWFPFLIFFFTSRALQSKKTWYIGHSTLNMQDDEEEEEKQTREPRGHRQFANRESTEMLFRVIRSLYKQIEQFNVPFIALTLTLTLNASEHSSHVSDPAPMFLLILHRETSQKDVLFSVLMIKPRWC